MFCNSDTQHCPSAKEDKLFRVFSSEKASEYFFFFFLNEVIIGRSKLFHLFGAGVHDG